MAKLPMGYGKDTGKAMQGFDALRNRMVHQDRIGRSKSTINNSWTDRQVGRLVPSQRNAKRHQHASDRFDDIERENRRLLNRFMEIDRKAPSWQPASWEAPPVLQQQRPQQQREEQRVEDLEPPGRRSRAGAGAGAPPAEEMAAGPAPRRPRARSQQPRLNPARKKELQRIADENARLLKKIQGARPAALQVNRLEEQHAHQQRVMRLRCDSQFAARNLRGGRRPPPTAMSEFDGPVDEEYERICQLERNLRKKLEGDHHDGAPVSKDRLQEALANFEPLDKVFNEARYYERRVEEATLAAANGNPEDAEGEEDSRGFMGQEAGDAAPEMVQVGEAKEEPSEAEGTEEVKLPSPGSEEAEDGGVEGKDTELTAEEMAAFRGY